VKREVGGSLPKAAMAGKIEVATRQHAEIAEEGELGRYGCE